MATTVPQNIKGNKIAGRHTPTRSSLRHSRMLVVNNKNYEGKISVKRTSSYYRIKIYYFFNPQKYNIPIPWVFNNQILPVGY